MGSKNWAQVNNNYALLSKTKPLLTSPLKDLYTINIKAHSHPSDLNFCMSSKGSTPPISNNCLKKNKDKTNFKEETKTK